MAKKTFMSPEFRRRLRREIKLFIRETRDGCVDCRLSHGGVCSEHSKVFMELAINPRKYIKINPDKEKS